jgi:hypothetical protein
VVEFAGTNTTIKQTILLEEEGVQSLESFLIIYVAKGDFVERKVDKVRRGIFLQSI